MQEWQQYQYANFRTHPELAEKQTDRQTSCSWHKRDMPHTHVALIKFDSPCHRAHDINF